MTKSAKFTDASYIIFRSELRGPRGERGYPGAAGAPGSVGPAGPPGK